MIKALKAVPDKLPLLLGNSGVGKSSLAQAGVLAALMRQDWPETAEAAGAWPRAFKKVGRGACSRLSPAPIRCGPGRTVRPLMAVRPHRSAPRNAPEGMDGKSHRGRGTLRGLLDATEERLQEQGQSKPPAFYSTSIKAKSYTCARTSQRQRFSQILAEGLADHVCGR